MPKYKNNHYFPRGLIAFWKPPKGNVVFWDRATSQIVDYRNPRSVHSEDYLYATWRADGTRDMSSEHHLTAEVDDQAPNYVAELIARIEAGSVSHLSVDERSFFARMLIRTVMRNPKFLRSFASEPLANSALKLIELSRNFLSLDHDSAVDRYGAERVAFGELVAYTVTTEIDEFVEQLASMQIVIIVPEAPARNYVLGSQPYLLRPNVQFERERADKEKQKVFGDFTLVVHPRILVHFISTDNPGPPEVLYHTDEDVLRINGLTVKYSEQIVMVQTQDVDGAWHHPYGKEESSEVATVRVRAI